MPAFKTSGFSFITRHKFTITILLFLHLNAKDFIIAQILNDYPKLTILEPELIQYPVGGFIKLKCSVQTCLNETIKWEYKACQPELYKHKCLNRDFGEWFPVPVNIKFKPCTSAIILKNVTSQYNGFYRCSIVSNDIGEVKIVKIYEFRVLEQIKNMKGAPPKLLDVHPLNATIKSKMKTALQCKVHSPIVYPFIFWFKLVEPGLFNNSFFYNNNSYIILNSSQIGLDDDIYINKLIIESSSESDSGIYKCLAMNLFGSSDKNVYLHVIDENSYEKVQKDNFGKEKVLKKDTSSFLMLFLIPLSMALVPIVIWLCYYRNKHMSKHETSRQSSLPEDFYKYQPILIRNDTTIPEITSQPIV